MRRSTDEPDMFGAVEQPRNAKTEPKRLYADVVFLRQCGLTVFRAGRQSHNVNGRVVDNEALRAIAAAWRKDRGLRAPRRIWGRDYV